MYYEHSVVDCPKCGGQTHQEHVDIGVGVIYGPRGCTECAWSEDPDYDLSGGRNPVDANGGCIDQYGCYYPHNNTTAKAYTLAEDLYSDL